MNNESIKCIICGNIKQGSDEHIIPKSLGNELLRINMICKECNDGLGRYVDNHLVNNYISQMIRNQLNLNGQSKKRPNPFAKGKEQDGRDIYLDDEFRPHLPLRLDKNGDIIRTTGGTEKEAIKALKCKLTRMGKTNSEIKEILNNAEIKENSYIPRINYQFEIQGDKLILGALKIAYEYMYLCFGEQFYKDNRGQQIRQVLFEATKGNFDKIYDKMQLMDKGIFKIYENIKHVYPNSHILSLVKDNVNQLICNIILFQRVALSFSICVSDVASDYDISEKGLVIIDIDKQNMIKF